jgi:hypothetical protein
MAFPPSHSSSARAASVWRLAVLALVLVLISGVGIAAAGCGDNFAGTTWKGEVMANEITMVFGDDGMCTVSYGLAGMDMKKETGAYVVDGDQVTVGSGDQKMVLTLSGDTLKGTVQGVDLTFTKQ